ncbi:transcriptional regulator family: Fungal Specific TF [Penicillium samsonianum]|uniref:transcriptional regulator family: Fungal Specific TF n=1 Tax=Penicillium samsonianum TaxID=1882272 RepID=UPI00254933CA|nr:transcriptional regulator family: Fungal Specific TF [Penicillium samsonianum]KAJ6124559.1 transcriptional regulator family: Fungal Specific TF [Penicillium samsonianum]
MIIHWPVLEPYTRKRKRFTNSLSPGRNVSISAPLSQTPRSSHVPPESPEAQVALRRNSLSESHRVIPIESNTAVAANNGEPFIKEESYRGRSEYLGGSVPFDENMVKPGRETTYTSPKASETDLKMLRDQGAFELPPVSVQTELMASFNTHCASWTPVVDPKWLDESAPRSMLLLQAVFLAGSRVSKAHLDYGSSEVFYRRAKLLFFFGGCDDPLISIVAACLLHWYNPVGPEDVSTDTSGFWIRTAGAMAFQIGLHKEPAPNSRDRGLRRRLWWSLVVRDNIISVGVGRPRTINLRDSDVLPPSLSDFPVNNFKSQLFLAYCTICRLLGDTVESHLRKEISRQRQVDLENAVYRWANQVIPRLRSSVAAQDDAVICNFEVQQLLVMYFVVLTILHRSPTPGSVPPAASLVASSFIAGIYEEFLLRDELRYLGPVFAFYPLCAGLSLLSSCRYAHLQSTAEHELTVMKLSLQKLSERWLSAVGPLRALNNLTEKVRELGPFGGSSPTLDPDAASFFEGFDTKLCKQWQSIGHSSEPISGNAGISPTCTMADIQVPNDALRSLDAPPGQQVDTYDFASLDVSLDPFSNNWEGAGFDWSGSWLLNI